VYYYFGLNPAKTLYPHRFRIDLIKTVSVTCGRIYRAFSGSNLPDKNRNGPRRDKYPLPRNSKSPGADKLPSAHKPGPRNNLRFYRPIIIYTRMTLYAFTNIYIYIYLYVHCYFRIRKNTYFYIHIILYIEVVVILYWTFRIAFAYYTEQRAREMGFSQTIFFIPRSKRSAPRKSTPAYGLMRPPPLGYLDRIYIVTGFTHMPTTTTAIIILFKCIIITRVPTEETIPGIMVRVHR